MSEPPRPDPGKLPASQLRRVIGACERYEADWRAGRRPRIEEFLAEVPESEQKALLGELLALELELRRSRGERPEPQEYRKRFPGQAALVDALFAEKQSLPSRQAGRPKTDRRRADADRGLLLGLLALQNNFVDRDALLAAFTAWVADKARPLGQILRERGALDADTYALLEALVRKHLDLHAGDPERSLAALSSLGPVRQDLERIADPDLYASLARVAIDRGAGSDPDATPTFNVGSTTSPGGRFRILRLHERGGLGEIFVARDEELNREVALKQIQDRHANDPQSRSRFVVEAEITGGLEHPGIIPIYGLGSYDDGRPFYAMRFIRGDSLKQTIKRFHEAEGPGRDPGERLLELRKLLARFLDVCNAVAYAHSRGVLHRDLKPGNILLGPYGETLVVDWGLAKVIGRLEGAGSAEGTLRPASASGSSETLPGSALGTPAYMSPEQAAGDLDRLGPRSDVYSLGATLYCLLTGKAPFGSEADEILRKVQRGEFPHPRQIDPSIDKAMEAVCLKAMATRSEDRYPTALELAEDLERWLADEPVVAFREPFSIRARRWMRRHRTATTSGMLACLVLLGALGVGYRLERIHAASLAAEKRIVEEREKLAIDAVRKFRDTVVTNPDLRNRADLKALRETLLKEALNYFRTLRDEMQSTDHTRPEAMFRLSQADWELAMTLSEIGNKAEALRAYDEARSIVERVVREHPADTRFQWSLAACYNNLGVQQRDLGQTAAAIDSFEKAMAVRERLARVDPGGSNAEDVRVFRARIQDNIGKLQNGQGQYAAALESFQRTVSLWEELAREIPSYQRRLADAHGNVGNQQWGLGQHTAAITSYQKALVILEGLARRSSPDTNMKLSLAAMHSNIGLLRLEQGQPAEAIRSFQESLAIGERLVENEPAVTRFLTDLSNTYNNLGGAQRTLGHPVEAIRSFEKAVAIRERLAQDNPTVPGFQLDLAKSYINIGAMQLALNQPAAAIASDRKGVIILERLVREHPTNATFQENLAASLYNTGFLRMVRGQITASLESFQKAVAILEPLAEAQPWNARYQNYLARNYRILATSNALLGFLRLARGQATASLVAFEKALSLMFKLKGVNRVRTR